MPNHKAEIQMHHTGWKIISQEKIVPWCTVLSLRKYTVHFILLKEKGFILLIKGASAKK